MVPTETMEHDLMSKFSVEFIVLVHYDFVITLFSWQ